MPDDQTIRHGGHEGPFTRAIRESFSAMRLEQQQQADNHLRYLQADALRYAMPKPIFVERDKLPFSMRPLPIWEADARGSKKCPLPEQRAMDFEADVNEPKPGTYGAITRSEVTWDWCKAFESVVISGMSMHVHHPGRCAVITNIGDETITFEHTRTPDE